LGLTRAVTFTRVIYYINIRVLDLFLIQEVMTKAQVHEVIELKTVRYNYC